MLQIIIRIKNDLKEQMDEKTKDSFQRFFKEEVKCYGVKTNAVEKIAKKYFEEIKTLDKREIYFFCEQLLKSGYCEEAFIAANWTYWFNNFDKKDIKVFERWIDKYIDNWAKCDSFCNHTVGSFLEKYPEEVSILKKWSGAKNRWMKRASAVSLIIPAKKGDFLKEIFEIADILLLDKDDMVQKGYGWMLKEASRKHQKEVFKYVLKKKKEMPRTSLRYAIEKMPRELRVIAMSKD